jgi:hypothetical protein
MLATPWKDPVVVIVPARDGVLTEKSVTIAKAAIELRRWEYLLESSPRMVESSMIACRQLP